MTWCVVKCGSVYLDSGSCRYKECLDLRCIIGIIRLNVLLMSDQKDKICNRYIDLGITMILHCIQLLVMAVAVSDLDRQPAVSLILQVLHNIQCLQLLNRWNIDYVLWNRSVFHLLDKTCKVVSLQHLSIFTECRICYFLNLHD